MTPFRDKVIAVVKGIPAGSVLTYGEVAILAGNPGAARAVGTIMRSNQYSFLTTANRAEAVPCHRVVAAGRRLGGFNGGEEAKQQLLIAEGWQVEEGRIIR